MAERELTDAQLVHNVLRGDRDSYAQLVTRHQQALYRHMRGMGLDHDTALDLVQDALVKSYTRITDCKDPAFFRAWLFRIARNLCLDYFKNVRRSVVPFSQTSGFEEVHDTHHSDDELGVTLYDALDRIPLPMREAFLLKHDAGYTYEEIAEMTDATPSAVKMRVHRARETLRDYLLDNGAAAD